MKRSRVLASRLRERVFVTKKNGDTFAGVLYSIDPTVLVLRQTEAIGAGENKTDLPLDGEVIVFIADVDFIQRP